MTSTGVGPRETTAFRRGILDGKQLTVEERERLMKPYLPAEPSSSDPSRASSPAPNSPSSRRTARRPSHGKRKTGLVRHCLHVFIYTAIAFVFSVFFRFRRAWRLCTGKVVALLKHHHHTPEFIQKDTKELDKLPKHLSVILEYHERDEDQGAAGLEGLMHDVREIAAWTASVGIPFLSIYEPKGVLKNHIQFTHRAISQNLETYFGKRRMPTLSIRAPHLQSYSPPPTPPTRASSPSDRKMTPQHLTVLLLSREDGRDTLIDLTKTLSDMSQNGTLHPDQITSNLIDAELSEAVSSEPELLVLFSPTVQLKGYPPWQLRLTEIFHLPDNKGVNYQVFLRALHNFAKMEMRLGR